MVKAGQKAPGFILPDKQSGEDVSLDELTENQHVLLIFLRHLG
jgi:peroxiredoxin